MPDQRPTVRTITMTHDMQGPIGVGDFYVWEPMKDHARQVVFVAAVTVNRDGETWALLSDLTDQESAYWNEESRIREACVRIPIKAVMP